MRNHKQNVRRARELFSRACQNIHESRRELCDTRIKLCGMYQKEDIAAVNKARPDFCGFIVNFPASHRSLTKEQLKDLVLLLDPEVLAVGVFVDQDPSFVAELATDTIDVVQLHGHEDNAYIKELRSSVKAPIIQAIKMRTKDDAARANESAADMVLLDNGWGTGQSFDWSLTKELARPFILAGGLTPQNLDAAIREFSPWGVDISSGLETNKRKDPKKITAVMSVLSCHFAHRAHSAARAQKPEKMTYKQKAAQ